MKTNEDSSKGVHGVISKNDDEFTREILVAFNRDRVVPNVNVKAEIKNGWVTLEGDLIWRFQKDAMDKSVKSFVGVKGVTNNILIKSEQTT